MLHQLWQPYACHSQSCQCVLKDLLCFLGHVSGYSGPDGHKVCGDELQEPKPWFGMLLFVADLNFLLLTSPGKYKPGMRQQQLQTCRSTQAAKLKAACLRLLLHRPWLLS